MNRPQVPAVPVGLSRASASTWRRIVDDYEFARADLWILEEFFKATDRAAELRALVDGEGVMVPGRFGPRAHPAMAAERQYLLLASRLWRQLGLPPDQMPEPVTGDRVVDLRAR